MSVTQGVFDPLGILSPVLLPAKLLIQEVWAQKSDWDAALNEETRQKFQKWYEELQILVDFKIPRRVGFGNKDTWSLHIFCDSSQYAYATVIFLRCENDGEVHINFLIAKSRVAPVKKITIPRLELLACVLGARLSKYVVEALSLSNIPKFYWSDSTTALSWIKGNDQWGTFVGNRVKEICALTEANQWSYVPSQMNPADLPSRGCSPRHVLKLSWWEGPNWLKDPKDVWPTFQIKPDQTLVFSERRRGLTVLNVNIVTNSFKWYEKFSKFSKMVRILAWVRRFIKNVKRENVNKENLLSAVEVQESKNALTLLIQKESFSRTGDSINDLAVIRDDDGLIRVDRKSVV